VNRRALIVITLALAFPAAAVAKGPDAATVSGPGLSGQVPIGGIGRVTTARSSAVSSRTAATSRRSSGSPLTDDRHAAEGDLGPGYTVTYRVPGPTGKSTIRQIVYPFAKPAPVTYMESDQPFWDGQKTHGGWYVAAAQVKDVLGKVGLPASPPSNGSGFWRMWMLAPIVAAALALGALALLRRPWPLRGSPPSPACSNAVSGSGSPAAAPDRRRPKRRTRPCSHVPEPDPGQAPGRGRKGRVIETARAADRPPPPRQRARNRLVPRRDR